MSFPSYLYIEITTACNLNCCYCNRKRLSDKNQYLSFLKFKESLNKFPRLISVNIIGLGEPFLHPELKEMCTFLTDKKLGLDITTNGTIMNDDIISYLPPNTKVTVSLDSIKKDRLEATRGIDPDTVVRNIIKLIQKRRDINLILQPVIVEGFSEEVEKYISLGKMLKATIHPVLPALSNKEDFEQLYPSEEEIKTIVEAFKGYNKFSPNITIEPEYRMCGEPFNILLMTIDGNLYPCCFMNSIRPEGKEWYREFYKGDVIFIDTSKYQLGNIDNLENFNWERLSKIREIIKATTQSDFLNRREISDSLQYCSICLSRWKRGC